jgi:hypothetical protein
MQIPTEEFEDASSAPAEEIKAEPEPPVKPKRAGRA